MKEIHKTCQGFREAELAEAELEAYGSRGDATKRLIEGSLDAGTYSGLIEGDVRSLLTAYQEHPNASFQGQPLKTLLSKTVGRLRAGGCDPEDASRLAHAIG